MSPQFIHDRNSLRLAMVVDRVTEMLRIPCQGTVTTTLRRKGDRPRKGSGKEPDYGFYFGENELRMRGISDEIDLDVGLAPPTSPSKSTIRPTRPKRRSSFMPGSACPRFYAVQAEVEGPLGSASLGRRSLAKEPVDRSLNPPRLTPALVVQALDEAECHRRDRLGSPGPAWAVELPEAPATAWKDLRPHVPDHRRESTLRAMAWAGEKPSAGRGGLVEPHRRRALLAGGICRAKAKSLGSSSPSERARPGRTSGT